MQNATVLGHTETPHKTKISRCAEGFSTTGDLSLPTQENVEINILEKDLCTNQRKTS